MLQRVWATFVKILSIWCLATHPTFIYKTRKLHCIAIVCHNVIMSYVLIKYQGNSSLLLKLFTQLFVSDLTFVTILQFITSFYFKLDRPMLDLCFTISTRRCLSSSVVLRLSHLQTEWTHRLTLGHLTSLQPEDTWWLLLINLLRRDSRALICTTWCA